MAETWPKIDADGVPYWEKDPDAEGEYGVDWTDWLADPGEGAILATSQWIVPAGLTVGPDTNDDQRTKILLSGGTVPETYDLTNRVTAGLLTEDRVIRIKMVAAIGR